MAKRQRLPLVRRPRVFVRTLAPVPGREKRGAGGVRGGAREEGAPEGVVQHVARRGERRDLASASTVEVPRGVRAVSAGVAGGVRGRADAVPDGRAAVAGRSRGRRLGGERRFIRLRTRKRRGFELERVVEYR